MGHKVLSICRRLKFEHMANIGLHLCKSTQRSLTPHMGPPSIYQAQLKRLVHWA